MLNMFAETGRRHTPEPVYVRFAMLGLLSLGMGLGLLGALVQVWALHLALDAPTAGTAFLGLAAGTVPAVVLGRRFSRSIGPGTRVLFVASGVLAAADLTALSYIYDAAYLPALLFVLGMALGGFAGAVTGLLFQILTIKRAPEILNLAGVSFSLGGLIGCLIVRLALPFLTPDWILRATAVLPLMPALAALRVGRFKFEAPRPGRAAIGWSEVISPSLVLLGLSLLLQAAAYGIVGCWLTVYLSRGLGLTTSGSLGVLLLFWGAMTVGRVLAARMPPMRDRLFSLIGPAAGLSLGCVFLLQTTRASGAAMGAALLGAGLGALHPLTLRMVQRRYPSIHQSRLNALMYLSLGAALAACGPVGHFAGDFGIELVVWAALGCSTVAAAVLMVLLIEQRVSGESAAV